MVTRRVKLAVWWRRAGITLRLFVFFAGAALLGLLVYWQRPQDESSQLGGGLLVFLLVNLNIVIICVLAFLVGRNIVRLIFDRRKNILGSKLRLRLVVAFVGLALVPTCLLFVLASGLLNRAMEGWFSSQVEASVTGGVEVARHHYDWLKDHVRRVSESTAEDLQGSGLSLRHKKKVRTLLEAERRRHALFGLQIIGAKGREIVSVKHAAASIEAFSEPRPDIDAVQKALRSRLSVLFEERGAGQFVRGYAPLAGLGEPAVLLATVRVNPKLTHALAQVTDSYKEYEQLKFFKNPLRSGYLLTLAMITGFVLFSAIWIGFHMAREIAVPIQHLAEGTRAVAKGDYDYHVRASGDDEIAFLMRSFNRMTDDLKLSRNEAERQRLFVEAILSNLAVGVIALDIANQVTSINRAAAVMFDIADANSLLGRDLRAALGDERFERIQPVLLEVEQFKTGEGGTPAAERELGISGAGRERKVMCTGGLIVDIDGHRLGTLLLFDDITDLSKAQQMAAWREVARRIAHEIKNPLTPIQLSAQRLGTLIDTGNREAIGECTQTIVEQVGTIKRLANEFSRFARMPTAEFQSANLNQLISDVVSLHAENNTDIIFQFVADDDMPAITMDREQIRAALLNLFDNAIFAVRERAVSAAGGYAPKIVVKSNFSKRRRSVTIEIADNGTGIAQGDKARIFDPYFTRKQGGTGLGLAIVSSTVADHQGDIRVYDNQPQGVKFVIELPVGPTQLTVRRFARDAVGSKA